MEDQFEWRDFNVSFGLNVVYLMFGNNNNNFINEIYVMSHSIIYFPHQSYTPMSGLYLFIYYHYRLISF